MTKKDKNYKPITTVEIICTPVIDDNNKVSGTDYDLKITNNGYEVIIPINKKVTSLPTNELINKILDILNITEAEVTTKNNMPVQPVIVPVSPRDPINPIDPWREIKQPIITYSTTTPNPAKKEIKEIQKNL